LGQQHRHIKSAVLLRISWGTHWELEKPFGEFHGNPWGFYNKNTNRNKQQNKNPSASNPKEEK
jgi:hypothetical protein